MIMGLILAGGLAVGAGEATKGDAKAGGQLYQTYCATCHGKTGKGDGPSAANLNPKPRNHTDKKYMSSESDEEFFNVIKGGGASMGKSPLMPAWGTTLKDDQIRNVVAYLRKLCKCAYKAKK